MNEKPKNVFSFISTLEIVEKKYASPVLYILVLKGMNFVLNECLPFEGSRIGLMSVKKLK